LQCPADVLVDAAGQVAAHRLGGGRKGLVSGVDGPGVGAQRGPGVVIFAQQVVAGVAGQPPDCLDLVPDGDTQDPAGPQRQHQQHHHDGDGRAEGRLFQAEQQQRIGELIELHVYLVIPMAMKV
jgi:hypothetical protein